MDRISDAPRGEIAIYRDGDKKVRIDVNLRGKTIWLTQGQIAALFQADRSVVTKHISNIFKSKELEEKSNVQKMHIAFSDKPVKMYSLDVVISVGYRVNSKRATQFRIWATDVLKRHLTNGYTLNEKRLREKTGRLENLQRSIRFIAGIKERKELDHREAMGLLDVISDYNYGLGLLDDYDNKKIKITKVTSDEKFRLDYESALGAVGELRKKFGSCSFFGKEKDKTFRSSIGMIYQTFDGKELYPSVEEKAANLLYFIVKNHSFIDGNKRIAASIFLWFLEKNKLLYRRDGVKRL
ncbi:MAG: virulence protein RhuM/Fic/DOC family protein, partial [Candidatus Omnitrophica bacterium]|nr:virulence protein RhuM/Fic/DOC family protein [Candidatus Omnitrophota bacterium]